MWLQDLCSILVSDLLIKDPTIVTQTHEVLLTSCMSRQSLMAVITFLLSENRNYIWCSKNIVYYQSQWGWDIRQSLTTLAVEWQNSEAIIFYHTYCLQMMLNRTLVFCLCLVYIFVTITWLPLKRSPDPTHFMLPDCRFRASSMQVFSLDNLGSELLLQVIHVPSPFRYSAANSYWYVHCDMQDADDK